VSQLQPEPNSGVFNYIWYVNGWYIYANHSHHPEKGSPMFIKICSKLKPHKDYFELAIPESSNGVDYTLAFYERLVVYVSQDLIP